MGEPRAIGYVGVDVLNNATICNEGTGLLRAGVPLRVASVYRFERPTFYRDASLEALRDATESIFPTPPARAALACLAAPIRFRGRLISTIWKALTGPAEGIRQRLTLLWQLVPAILLATRWRDSGIGHIHAHWAHTAASVAMHAAELLGVGFSFTGHANDLFVHRVALVQKLRRARFVVCISEFHRRFYLDLGADPDRLVVIYCGIDLDRFRDDAGVPAAPASHRPRVLGVGRLVPKKGFADLVDACARLAAEGVDFECVIAGSGPDQASLAAQVARLGLGDRVEVTGRAVLQEDLPGLLRSADVMALPCVRDPEGDMDGLPQVLIEAMACGVPVVSTRLVGIPDLVVDGRTGLLVEPGDVGALADALRSLLEDPALARDLASRGRAQARPHFGLDESVRRIAALFRAAAGSDPRAPMAEALRAQDASTRGRELAPEPAVLPARP